MKYQVSVSEVSRYVDPNGHKQGETKRSVTSSHKFVFLMFLSINLFIVSFGALLFLGVFMYNENKTICLTEQCVNTASRILQAIDKKANPCIDFYQYACGNWLKSNPIPESNVAWDRLAVLRESLTQEMRQLLEVEDETESSGISKARLMYRTCMNTDKLEENGVTPLENILKLLGLSTNPPNTTNTHFDWLFTIARARRLLGVSIFYGFNVAEDVRNSSVNKIVIEQIAPGFSERYLLQPQKFSREIQQYKKYINSMIAAYTNETVENFANDVVKFSTQIAKVMTPAEIRRSPGHLFHEVNLVELANGPGFNNDTWKTVNWTRYTNIVFNDTNVILDPENDTAILLDLYYLQRMADLITSANKITLERYIWWSLYASLAPLTLSKFRELGFEFTQKLLGLKTKTPRWKICTNTVNTNFGLALSHLYIRNNFDQTYRDKAMEMLEDIKYAFEDTVHHLDWMDEITREKTLIKLHAIRAFVGYPGWIMNSTQLDHHYKEAYVIENNLFDTYLNLTNAAIKRNLQSIRKNPDRNRWVATPTTVNAFYSATLNSVTFPAGILKPPFYSNGILAVDYGSIGAIMGHEVTHGFDDQGRRYDENGNLKQWWSLTTLEHYHTKVQCIIEQYNNYSVPELGANFSVHGYNTQGENIADNGGLRAALEGYRRQQSKIFSHAEVLPGLMNLSSDQLFFLGYAQIWCGSSTVEALKKKLMDGVHSPNRIRVLGTLKNSEDFAKSWNCPIGSPMNPKKKCVLW